MRVASAKTFLLFLALSLAASTATAQDKKPLPGGLPSILEPVAPVPMPMKPGPLAVIPIDDGKVRIFWVTDYAGTVPIRWKTCQATGTASLTVISIGSAEVIVPLQGETTIAKQTIPPGAKHPVAVAGSGKGEVTLVADGVIGEEIVTLLSFRISVNQAAQPPPKDPPVEPPPVKTGTKYLLIVRENGPASQAFEKVMRDSGWSDLRKSGIQVRDVTLEESQSLYKAPNGTSIPFVVSLLISEDGSKATVVAGPVSMPTQTDSIKKLAEAFK